MVVKDEERILNIIMDRGWQREYGGFLNIDRLL